MKVKLGVYFTGSLQFKKIVLIFVGQNKFPFTVGSSE